MAKKHSPRSGSMQFWHRRRANKDTPKIRTWAEIEEVRPLAFMGYKVGMAHVMVIDNAVKSPTKGQTIRLPVTIVECPAMQVVGLNLYKDGVISTTVIASSLDSSISRKLSVCKKQHQMPEDGFDDVRLLVASLISKTGIGSKKPKMLEIAIGGKRDDKVTLAKEKLGKELFIEDVFKSGIMVDVRGITTGKGFAGAVKRFGVSIRSHKSEKTKRGAGSLGPWCGQGHVMYRVPMPGKMGYHRRTEYNKQIIDINKGLKRAGGFARYGEIKNQYVLIKGSVPGPRKRVVVLTECIRAKKPKAVEFKEIYT